MDVPTEIKKLQSEIAELRRNRFSILSVDEVETIKRYLFDRTSTSLASGATIDKYLIISVNGERRAIPTYNKFTP